MTTLLLDIDGTLLRSRGAGFRAILKVMNRRYGVTELPKVGVHGRTDKGIWRDIFSELEIKMPDSLDDLINEYCDFLDQELKEAPGDLLPGVVSFLERTFQDSKFYSGLLTGNAERAAWIKMERFGLSNLVSRFGGYGDHFVDRNCVAEMALASAKRNLGGAFDPEKVWVIGDTINDIRCARHINARILAVGTGGTPYSELEQKAPDALFADLSDVETLLECLS